MNEDRDTIILRTYNKTWRFEHKIYAIDKYRLPIAINPSELVYFVLAILFVVFIQKVLPPVRLIPFFIKYGIFPYAMMKLLVKKKFDGKYPHQFLAAYLDYISQPQIMARFKGIERHKPGTFTNVIYRKPMIVNMLAIKMVIRRRKGRGRRNAIRISDQIF